MAGVMAELWLRYGCVMAEEAQSMRLRRGETWARADRCMLAGQSMILVAKEDIVSAC